MNLALVLRSAHTWRWTIVNTRRRQNIAEHQYLVWLIAEAIWKVVHVTEHNTDEYLSMIRLALTHDLHEVLIGDVPSTAKNYIGDLHGGTDRARTAMGINLLPSASNTSAWHIVKIADTLEALLYLFNDYDGDPSVPRHVRDLYQRRLEKARKAFPNLDWSEVPVVAKIMSEDPCWASYLHLAGDVTP